MMLREKRAETLDVISQSGVTSNTPFYFMKYMIHSFFLPNFACEDDLILDFGGIL